MTSYVLRATPSIKRYHVAKFDGDAAPSFNTWKAPVMMTREVEKVEEEEEDDEPQSGNPLFRKRRRRRRKTNTPGWVLGDAEKEVKLMGALEGGVSTKCSYFVFMKTAAGEFSMVPAEEWFRFKKPLSYRTLTLDEAEEMDLEKKRNVERWMMKTKMGLKIGGEQESDVAAPRVRTGATLNRKETKEKVDDIFNVKAPASRKGKKKGGEAEATGEDGYVL